MPIKFKIDNKPLVNHLDYLASIPDKVNAAAGDYFRSITPIKTGNARNNTFRTDNVIKGDYEYASKLNEGSSKQARQGMVDPTIKFIEDYVTKLVGKR